MKEPIFVATPTPTDEDVKQVAETVAARAIRLLERRGVLGEQDVYDPFSEESPVLAGMTAASVRGMIATGDRAGLPVRRVLSDPAEGVRTSRLCYVSRGLTANPEWTHSSSRLYLCSSTNFVRFASQSYSRG
jgi:hypothetical protein